MVSKMKFLMLTAAFGVGSAVAEITPAVPDQDQESGCYLISNAEELYGFAAIVNTGLDDVVKNPAACGKLDADDITVNENVLNDDGTLNGTPAESWTPMVGFAGNFDGQGHSISGLYYSAGSSNSNAGLFFSVASGSTAVTIQNLTLNDSYFEAKNKVGSFVGEFLKGSGGSDLIIDHCVNNGTVKSLASTDSKIGGLVGYVNGAAGSTLTIINSSNAGLVTTAGKEVGGLVGSCQSACSISGSNNSGNLAGAEPIGGIVGYFNPAKIITIESSTNTGSINGGSVDNEDVIGAADGSKYDSKSFGAVTIDKGNAVVIGESTSETKFPYDINNIRSVEFERSFTAGKPATIVLPFDVPEGTTINARFYSLRAVVQDGNSWRVKMKYIGDGVQPVANTPYALITDGNELTFTFPSGKTATIKKAELITDYSEDNNWMFEGTYDYRVWTQEDEEEGLHYAFAAKDTPDGITLGQFVKIGQGAYTYPMRAYLRKKDATVQLRALAKTAAVSSIELPASMEVDFIDEENGTMGVGKLNTVTGEMKIERWYDMKGRKMNRKPTAKGVYFNQKVIVK